MNYRYKSNLNNFFIYSGSILYVFVYEMYKICKKYDDVDNVMTNTKLYFNEVKCVTT